MKFRMDELKRRAARLDLAGIDFDAFREQPLDDDALRCIGYMHDVEHHTICYLRDVLVTDAHRDHEITSFLTFWAFEEYWHGEALGLVLEAHDRSGSAARVAATRQRARWHDRLLPIGTMAANAVTRHVPAVHMTWGAINEWTAQAAYGQLARRAQHPVLTELLARIKRQEGRHIDFYATQATARLTGSLAAQRLTRFTLRRFWTPVGAGVMPASEVEHLRTYLFGDEAGHAAVARIDRQIDRLPGLAGLDLLAHEVARRPRGTGADAPAHVRSRVSASSTGEARVDRSGAKQVVSAA